MKFSISEAVLNLIFWGVSSWIILSGFSIQAQEIELIDGVETLRVVRNETLMLKLFICVLFSMILFYLQFLLIIHSGKKLRWELLVGLSAGLFALGYVGCSLISTQLVQNSLPLPVQTRFGILIFYQGIGIAYAMGKLWAQGVRQQEQLLRAKKEAELSLLRSQLQPHFLFNALNNLLSLVDQKSNPRLAGAINRLSGLLRHVVQEKTEGVTIAEEIEFIQDYIALQKLRFEDGEIRVQFDKVGKHDAQVIEPGLFIPYIENAFKYGAIPEEVSRIAISFDLEKDNRIGFRVYNDRVFPLNKQGNGTGLKVSRERLDLLYKDHYKLEILNEDGFEVKLQLWTVGT